MSTHDPRRQNRELREALQRYDREQLVDMISHLFGHYILEGSASDEGAAPRAPGLAAGEFSGLSFAEVIERLQLRLTLPELALFEIQRGQVHIRLDGRLWPLRADATAAAASALPGPARQNQPVQPTPAAPGIQTVQSVEPRLAQPARTPDAGPAANLGIPRAAGVTVRGNSVTVESTPRSQEPRTPGVIREELTPEAAARAMGRPAAEAPRPAAAPAAAPAPRPAPAPAADKPEPNRFGLLEID